MEYRNGVVRAWISFREKLKRIVESKYFNRGIMIAILVNTLSMGIEYHEQVRRSGREKASRRFQINASGLRELYVTFRGKQVIRRGLFCRQTRHLGAEMAFDCLGV